jgi:hypothetical protein
MSRRSTKARRAARRRRAERRTGWRIPDFAEPLHVHQCGGYLPPEIAARILAAKPGDRLEGKTFTCGPVFRDGRLVGFAAMPLASR